jgi:glycosyltransferase involved in cell wall biosynthesis
MLGLAILIPAYNEEKNIKNVLSKLQKYNVYLINDGSNDKTFDIAQKFTNVKISNNKINLGYENSLIKGFNIILKKNFKYILTIDADGEHSLNKIKQFCKFAIQTDSDLVVGKRSKFNRVSEKIVSFFFKIRFKISDPLSGFKLYKTSTLKKIIHNIKDDNTFLVKILFIFLKKNCNVQNFDIVVNKRYGSRVGNSLSTNIKIIKLISYII